MVTLVAAAAVVVNVCQNDTVEAQHFFFWSTSLEELSTVLYCTVLYCTVLYCTVLYCTVPLAPKIILRQLKIATMALA